MAVNNLKISITPYIDGRCEIILIDEDTGGEMSIPFKREFMRDELAFLNRVAPPCTWTRYRRVEPDGS